jgi:prefoldin subunit 5
MPTSDPRIDALKLRKQQLEIEMKAVTTEMASIRANYSERQSNIFFKPSRHHKDALLRRLQPRKQQLQAQILTIRQEIALIQAGKK